MLYCICWTTVREGSNPDSSLLQLLPEIVDRVCMSMLASCLTVQGIKHLNGVLSALVGAEQAHGDAFVAVDSVLA